jgi:hypothetical protein
MGSGFNVLPSAATSLSVLRVTSENSGVAMLGGSITLMLEPDRIDSAKAGEAVNSSSFLSRPLTPGSAAVGIITFTCIKDCNRDNLRLLLCPLPGQPSKLPPSAAISMTTASGSTPSTSANFCLNAASDRLAMSPPSSLNVAAIGTPGTTACDMPDRKFPTKDFASHQNIALTPFESRSTVDHIPPAFGIAGKSREVQVMRRSDAGFKCKLLPRFVKRNVTLS